MSLTQGCAQLNPSHKGRVGLTSSTQPHPHNNTTQNTAKPQHLRNNTTPNLSNTTLSPQQLSPNPQQHDTHAATTPSRSHQQCPQPQPHHPHLTATQPQPPWTQTREALQEKVKDVLHGSAQPMPASKITPSLRLSESFWIASPSDPMK